MQILSSVQAHTIHGEICSTNDCKVVLNHLVRKFSEPLTRENGHRRLVSRKVANGATDDTVDDHAVPVIVIVEKLLRLPASELPITQENLKKLEDFLRASLLIVEITRDEDLKLCSRGFQRCMPTSWSDPTSKLFQQHLARYVEAGIEV
ncbi:hypothetical protein [Polaromonas sp. JS666]|uniref:hypothetical protein n=1 Tax=Polaromonas sp. (strain JS666 / ATCC BAA-500) TaxID=296591 RepID=UPI001E570F9B|nr:hypothetical protein [Polaromonas sp. JS666]